MWIDPKSSFAVFNSVSSFQIVESQSPITMAKAIKNDVEINGMRQCHIRDGSALVHIKGKEKNTYVITRFNFLLG